MRSSGRCRALCRWCRSWWRTWRPARCRRMTSRPCARPTAATQVRPAARAVGAMGSCSGTLSKPESFRLLLDASRTRTRRPHAGLPSFKGSMSLAFAPTSCQGPRLPEAPMFRSCAEHDSIHACSCTETWTGVPEQHHCGRQCQRRRPARRRRAGPCAACARSGSPSAARLRAAWTIRAGLAALERRCAALLCMQAWHNTRGWQVRLILQVIAYWAIVKGLYMSCMSSKLHVPARVQSLPATGAASWAG